MPYDNEQPSEKQHDLLVRLFNGGVSDAQGLWAAGRFPEEMYAAAQENPADPFTTWAAAHNSKAEFTRMIDYLMFTTQAVPADKALKPVVEGQFVRYFEAADELAAAGGSDLLNTPPFDDPFQVRHTWTLSMMTKKIENETERAGKMAAFRAKHGNRQAQQAQQPPPPAGNVPPPPAPVTEPIDLNSLPFE